MPPPKPKRFFRIRRRSDGLLYRNFSNRFEKTGSRFREKELLRTLRRLRDSFGADDLEVLRFDVVPYPPPPLGELLKKMEEAAQKDWPLL